MTINRGAKLPLSTFFQSKKDQRKLKRIKRSDQFLIPIIDCGFNFLSRWIVLLRTSWNTFFVNFPSECYNRKQHSAIWFEYHFDFSACGKCIKYTQLTSKMWQQNFYSLRNKKPRWNRPLLNNTKKRTINLTPEWWNGIKMYPCA